ncbi:MAG: type I DNA topoisomerase [Rhodospirillaceae bacterium]
MPGNSVVIVESPAKAKTINKYLGQNFTVLASFGHVRDLPPRDGSVRPDDDFAMDWELGDRSKRHIDEIVRAVKGADRVFLATDPDREGEAIAWHVQELLTEKKLAGRLDIQRVTFNEITKSAVLAAMAKPRQVDRELVDAYLARRALDYLVGFTLSPVLWRKLPGSKSAGRVQSVALRLICQREGEIEAFRSQEFWTIEATFRTVEGASFTARLIQLDGKKLDKFAFSNKEAAENAVARLKPLAFSVASVEHKQVKRNPYPPFTTSTLQQEASRKLGLGASRTMRIAQKLYEGIDIGGETVGLITYMRTDGVSLSQEAIDGARRLINSSWGERYLPSTPRIYKATAKNAQEAHEAIRPTDLSRRPEEVARYLDKDELKLYELVWKRTVACQMASALLDQATVDISAPKNEAMFRATGSIVVFDGFLRVYNEDRDDVSDDDESERRLPPVKEKDALTRQGDIRADQHYTQPPPRYTEASLVKRLEELGIGRPSTYASIIQVLQDREYVCLEKKRFEPEDRGRLVTAFLESFFERYVEYTFTADLENKLDDISGGRIDWKTVLREFWGDFSAAIGGTKDLTITQVIDTLDASLGAHFFPAEGADGADPRVCPGCRAGRLGLKLSKNGAFIGCSQYPTCRYTRPLAVAGAGSDDEARIALEGPRLLGTDPDTGLPVTVRRGPYGAYVQLGPADEPAPPPPPPEGEAKPKTRKKKADAVAKPKRVSIPKGLQPTEIDLDTGLRLLSLPREVGRHPESSETITAGIGRFGPYLKHGPAYKSLADDDDVLTIGLNRAVVLLAETKVRSATPAGRVIGDHPVDGKAISAGAGRYGPYVKHGSLYASLPKGLEPDEVTLAQALELLEAKAAKVGVAPVKAKAATKSKAKAEVKTKSKTKAEAEPEAPTEKPAAKVAKPKAAAKAKTEKSKTKTAPVANDAGPPKRGSRKAATS